MPLFATFSSLGSMSNYLLFHGISIESTVGIRDSI